MGEVPKRVESLQGRLTQDGRMSESEGRSEGPKVDVVGQGNEACRDVAT